MKELSLSNYDADKFLYWIVQAPNLVYRHKWSINSKIRNCFYCGTEITLAIQVKVAAIKQKKEKTSIVVKL